MNITFRLALAIVFAALVCVATIVFVVGIPATSGYFNIGETMIYISALLFGPYVGAFAGGVGSAIADLLLAPEYALGTFVVKGCEGAIVGLLSKRAPGQITKSQRSIAAIAVGLVVGILIFVSGTLHFARALPLGPLVATRLWGALGGVSAFLITLLGMQVGLEFGRDVFSLVVGGLEMVLGYFLYERLILGYEAAIVEIPVNIGQVLVGMLVAIPVSRIVRRWVPQLVRRQ